MRPVRYAEFIEDEPRLIEEWLPHLLTVLPSNVLDCVVKTWQLQGDPNRSRCTITLRQSLEAGSDRHVQDGTLRRITPIGVQCRFKEVFGRGKDTIRLLVSA